MEVADALVAAYGAYGLAQGSFSVHKHKPVDFLIFFACRETRDRVLADEVLQSPYLRLLLKPWSRRAQATGGRMSVRAEVEIEGLPANVWNLSAAEAILTPAAWVERLDPLTRSRADMGTFRLTAWCLDPAEIPLEVDLHVVEAGGPPTAEELAAAADLVIPPSVRTLVYPLTVHVMGAVRLQGRCTPTGAERQARSREVAAVAAAAAHALPQTAAPVVARVAPAIGR
jgi:hypothetical protein